MGSTTAFLAKLGFAVLGMIILIVGFGIRVRAADGWLSSEVVDPDLDRVGDWFVAGGAAWLGFALLMWIIAPRAWDVLAQFLMAIILVVAIIGNLLLGAIFEILGLPPLATPGENLPWRIALAIGCGAIVIAQLAVANALKDRPGAQPGAVLRLRLSAIGVLVFGGIAAWTLPSAFVATLVLVALIYIAIELLPR